MGYQNLNVERRDRVAVVTLNRPDKLNALDAILRDEILAVAEELGADDEVWAVVLTGAGRGFCSGVDLTGARPTEEREQSQSQRLDELGWVGRQALAIYGLDKPTIAAVNGVAAGAGMSLALACDLRVGDASTRFRTVFVERNLSPDSGMSFFLPRIVGYSRAADMIMTSRDVGADDAYRMGLLDRLAGEGESLVETAVKFGALIASRPPLAVRSAKRVLQHNLQVDLEDALRYEMAGLSYARRARNDAREAMESFRERRPAKFTGT
jgi:enoyl-CoA hydratase/carnithine racemase